MIAISYENFTYGWARMMPCASTPSKCIRLFKERMAMRWMLYGSHRLTCLGVTFTHVDILFKSILKSLGSVFWARVIGRPQAKPLILGVWGHDSKTLAEDDRNDGEDKEMEKVGHQNKVRVDRSHRNKQANRLINLQGARMTLKFGHRTDL